MDLLIANHSVKLSPKTGVGAFDLLRLVLVIPFHFCRSEKEMESLNGVSGGLKMESEKGSLKVYKLVEYIKQQEFPFDTHDDFEEILNHFGIAFEPDSKDCSLLACELQKMVEQEQTSEITRAVLHEQGLDDEWRCDDENEER